MLSYATSRTHTQRVEEASLLQINQGYVSTIMSDVMYGSLKHNCKIDITTVQNMTKTLLVGPSSYYLHIEMIRVFGRFAHVGPSM